MKTRAALLSLLLILRASGADGGMKASEPKMKETLQGIVQKQLEAFRAGDFKAAYVFADDTIKAQFPLAAFEEMVKTGYPAIAKPESFTFGLTFDDGEQAVVGLRIVGADKTAADYQYLLKRTGEAWRVTGVVKVKREGIEV